MNIAKVRRDFSISMPNQATKYIFQEKLIKSFGFSSMENFPFNP